MPLACAFSRLRKPRQSWAPWPLHEPEIPWGAIRGFGNALRHSYDEIDLNAIERAVADIDRLDAASQRAIERLEREITPGR